MKGQDGSDPMPSSNLYVFENPGVVIK